MSATKYTIANDYAYQQFELWRERDGVRVRVRCCPYGIHERKGIAMSLGRFVYNWFLNQRCPDEAWKAAMHAKQEAERLEALVDEANA